MDTHAGGKVLVPLPTTAVQRGGQRRIGGANRIMLMPHTGLGNGKYTVTAATGIKDVAGDALVAPYTWRFTVGAPTRTIDLPLVLRP